MAQQIVSNIETRCDICGIQIYGDSHPNHALDSLFIEDKSLNVSVNIDVQEYGHKVNDMCPECFKKLLRGLLDKWGG